MTLKVEVFERTAVREKWPEEDWGALLAPFLTEESMPSADSGDKECHYGMTFWARQGTTAPCIPVRVANQDREAVLDSGSMVILVRPEFALGPRGPPIVVSCIHRDKKSYPTTQVKMVTPRDKKSYPTTQ
ncbi:hypothetical protein M9458_008023, partial [Cirrhinus mrigala]